MSNVNAFVRKTAGQTHVIHYIDPYDTYMDQYKEQQQNKQ